MKYSKLSKHILHFRCLYFALPLCAIFMAVLADSATPTRAALNAWGYEGRHELTNCTVIKGWAWDSERPFDPIYVDVYDGPNLIATELADLYRQDLFEAGKGLGRHGFQIVTPGFLKDGQEHSITIKFAGTNTNLQFSPRIFACDASLFPTAVPTATASGQGQTWEQGVEFSSSRSGTIKQVRFWRAAEEPKGNHLATLWSNSGQLLKSVPFNETTAPGWQYATFNYSIQANTRYRVTYNINNVVAKTFNVFNSGPIVSGPLTAWGSRYTTPAFTFPTTGSTSNLFADIIFSSPH